MKRPQSLIFIHELIQILVMRCDPLNSNYPLENERLVDFSSRISGGMQGISGLNIKTNQTYCTFFFTDISILEIELKEKDTQTSGQKVTT